MKKTILFLFYVFLFLKGHSILSQGWIQINSPTTHRLRSAYFTDNNTGYICGDSGLIFKTIDGGVDWTQVNSKLKYVLYDIFFINANTGFVAGGRNNAHKGSIIRTTNAGLIWDTVLTANYEITDLVFLNSDIGFAAGNGIFKTTNSGQNWGVSTILAAAWSIDFSSDSIGYATRDWSSFPNYMKTTNAGLSWGNYPNYCVATCSQKVLFLNFNTGFIYGGNYIPPTLVGGAILRTTNAGVNWVSLPAFFSTSSFTSMTFVNNNTGFIVGGGGEIRKTTDVGLTWIEQSVDLPNWFNKIFFSDLNIGYIVGSEGVIFKTTDCGGNFIGMQIINSEIPDNYSLSQNFPNPFNPLTKIKFQIPKASFVKISVFDALGKELFNIGEYATAGSYEIVLDGTSYSSGIYFYRLEAGEFKETKKMVLIE